MFYCDRREGLLLTINIITTYSIMDLSYRLCKRKRVNGWINPTTPTKVALHARADAVARATAIILIAIIQL